MLSHAGSHRWMEILDAIVQSHRATSCFAVKDIAEFGNVGLQVIPVQNVTCVGQRSLLPLTQLRGAIGEDFHGGLVGTEVLQHYAHTFLEMRIYRLHKCKAAQIIIACSKASQPWRTEW